MTSAQNYLPTFKQYTVSSFAIQLMDEYNNTISEFKGMTNHVQVSLPPLNRFFITDGAVSTKGSHKRRKRRKCRKSEVSTTYATFWHIVYGTSDVLPRLWFLILVYGRSIVFHWCLWTILSFVSSVRFVTVPFMCGLLCCFFVFVRFLFAIWLAVV